MAEKLIDSHAHITSDTLFGDIEGILQRAGVAGVETIVNICTDQETAARGVDVAKAHQEVVNVGATTPHDVATLGEKDFPFFESLAKEGHLVAIGETGLDYFYEHSDKELQKEFLLRYFDLAKQVDLPVVIHCRDAFEDFFDLASKHFPSDKVLLHCFTGTKLEATEAVKRGYKISLSGIVTFKKSYDLQEVAKDIPMENLLVETDSPYLAPQSKRGKINQPANVLETAEFLAKLKQINFSDFCQKTRENTKNFFHLM